MRRQHKKEKKRQQERKEKQMVTKDIKDLRESARDMLKQMEASDQKVDQEKKEKYA